MEVLLFVPKQEAEDEVEDVQDTPTSKKESRFEASIPNGLSLVFGI